PYAMRTTPDLVKRRYFKEKGASFELVPEVRQMVSFELHNLRDRLAAKRHGIWDVIFCRNVMIYFDTEMKRQVVSMFGERLADDGTLFIGHSESIRDVSTAFIPMVQSHAFAYRKG